MRQTKQAIHLFDRFSITIPSNLKCHQDGSAGKRVLFLTDHTERFVISFEEGMQPLDALPVQSDTLRIQCSKNRKYIHLQRSLNSNYAFFYLELEDAEGSIVSLPGQMTVSSGYQWSDGIEPMLLELLEGITLI